MKNRHYPRLKNHDYRTPGAYFIALVCHRRAPLFGQLFGTDLDLSSVGDYVIKAWRALPQRNTAISLDAFVLMPNHLHGILWLGKNSARSLQEIINGFKAEVSREAGVKAWQRSFYDRVIRDENELFNVRRYIANNPKQWALDRLYVSS